MRPLILVTGGARSGKSDFAQKLAVERGGQDVLFVATAEPGDEEMTRRIAVHRQARPAAWRTIEAPRQVGQAIRQTSPAQAIIVDCLTLLISNVLLSLGDEFLARRAEPAIDEEIYSLLEAAHGAPGSVIVVTNEVGFGIVPDNRIARAYRDLLGRANATLARESDQVYLLVAGLAVEIKALAQRGGVS